MRAIIITILSLIFCSCQSDVARQRDIVESLIGRKIVIPDGLQWQIQETPVKYDPSGADYKVVSYINHGGCTSCRIKLPAWSKTINEFKTIEGIDIAFLIILETFDEGLISYLALRDKFLYPICLDSNNLFGKANQLPEDTDYHTFLLDSENRIIAVGNPATNPKLRKLYHRLITDSDETSEFEHMNIL